MNFRLAKIGVMSVGARRKGPTGVGSKKGHFVLVEPLRLNSRLAEEE